MTAFIILREAFSKNNNIWVIKSLKLMSFKYKKQFNSYRLTFKNEFDPSSVNYIVLNCFYT